MSSQTQNCEKQVGNFRFFLSEMIGKGSYGTVYLGKNTQNQQKVALKVVPINYISNHHQAQNMIQKEVEIMKKFNHPNIVRLYDVLETTNNKYIITEYCNGQDLKIYLEKNGSMNETEALKVLRNMVAGLKEIVQNGFIHRDLKPANVIKHDENFKITDFGFSRSFNQFEMMKSLVGTPLYMAPQILMYQQYSEKCDIWSLGLIFYEILFGQTPWIASNIPELLERIQNQPLIFPGSKQVSLLSKSFIKGCLQIEESKRYSWQQIFDHQLMKIEQSFIQDSQLKEVIAEKIKLQKQQQQEEKDEKISTLPKINSRDRSVSTFQFFNNGPQKNRSPQHQIGPVVKQDKLKQVIPIVNLKEELTSNNSSQTTNHASLKKDFKEERIEDKQPTLQKHRSAQNYDLNPLNKLDRIEHSKERSDTSRFNQRKTSQHQQEFYVPQPQSKSKLNIDRMRRTRSQLDHLLGFTQTTLQDIDIKQPPTCVSKNSKHQKSINSIFALQINKDQTTSQRTRKFSSGIFANQTSTQDKQKEILLSLIKYIESAITLSTELKQFLSTHKDILNEKILTLQQQFWLDGKKLITDTIKEFKANQKNDKDCLFIVILTSYLGVIKYHMDQKNNAKVLIAQSRLQEIKQLLNFCQRECDNMNNRKQLKTRN